MNEMPVLETERLLIRPFQHADLQAIHQILDIELAPVEFGTQGAMSEPDRRSWLEWTIAGYRQLAELNQPPYGDRAVMLKTRAASSSTLIGAAGFVPSFAPFGQLHSFGGKPSRNSAEVGLYYAISTQHQRRGYALEAAHAMVRYAFSALGLGRLVATTTADNLASIGVMRRLGMRVEKNPFPDPPWFQVVGILEDERRA
jgi:RimJ/RimL family protein N-acetyltransferase